MAFVAHHEPPLGIKEHEAVRDRLDRRLKAHLPGDVDRERHHVAAARAPVHEAHPHARGKAQLDRGDVLGLPARAHPADPGLGGFARKVDEAALRRDAQQFAIGNAGLHRGDRLERGEKGAVGGDKALAGVEDGKAVVDGVDRIPQPPLGHHRGGMRAFEIVDEARREALERRGLGARRGGLLALFVELVGDRAGMERELFVRGQQLAAFLFEHPFGRKPRAPLARESLCHRVPRVHLPAARPKTATAPGRLRAPHAGTPRRRLCGRVRNHPVKGGARRC